MLKSSISHLKAKKKWRQKNPTYQSTWRKKNPEKIKKYKDKWEKLHREKYLAQRKLQYAVKVGKLTRLPCQKCGDIQTHGHHTDYSKPLNVIWLCEKHHKELHTSV